MIPLVVLFGADACPARRIVYVRRASWRTDEALYLMATYAEAAASNKLVRMPIGPRSKSGSALKNSEASLSLVSSSAEARVSDSGFTGF
jgi:hypothetical protein